MKIYEADQYDLFSGMVDRNGEVLRDRGIEKVSETNKSWLEACIDAFQKSFVGAIGEFTGEDIRFLMEAKGLIPSHPNAWGALTNTLARRKLIVKTGQYRQPIDKTSHARAIQVYRLP